MKALRLMLIVCASLAVGVACSGDEPEADKPKPVARPKPKKKVDEAAATEAAFRYDPEGKPDPFVSYLSTVMAPTETGLASPLQRFDLSQLRLTGIVWKNESPRALIQDPTGKGYIVESGTPIGKNRGHIVSIEDNRVIVKETYVDYENRATTKEVDMHLYERNGG